MAPNSTTEEVPIRQMEEITKASPRQFEIVWINVIFFAYCHMASLYGLYLMVTSALWPTIVLNIVAYFLSVLGITAGVHRLWSHRSYKARMPLQVFLMLCHTLTNQHTAIHWVRDHRLHHKYSDTDGDPHNSSRGFFYSHIGWLLVKKHPIAKAKGKDIDLSDVYNNPVLRFQQNNASWLIATVAFILPSTIPLFWSEQLSTSYHLNLLRFVISLNAIFAVNSVAHIWGYRPYDKHIKPTQNDTLSFLVLGEGLHNFHHAFPHDYRSSEFLASFRNPTARFIDFCARIGLAYDLRSMSDEGVKARMKRTGEYPDY